MFSKTNNREGKIESMVGMETNIEGNIQTNESIRIDGKVKGQIKAASVIIGEQGVVFGDVFADHVIVGGKIKGNISAGIMLEILAKGQIIGDIHTNKLMIVDGANFEGNCQMSQQDGQILELKPHELLVEGEEHHVPKQLKVVGNNGKH